MASKGRTKKEKFITSTLTEEQKRRKRIEEARRRHKKEELKFRSSTPLDVSPKPTMRK